MADKRIVAALAWLRRAMLLSDSRSTQKLDPRRVLGGVFVDGSVEFQIRPGVSGAFASQRKFTDS